MNKIGIFYGPEKGSVGKVAHLIEEKIGTDKCDLVLVKNISGVEVDAYDKLIFGISTLGRTNWDSEHEDDDWDVFFTHLKEAKWRGKKVAIYGLGDSVNYPDHFVDAVGWLYERLKEFDVEVLGFMSTEGYSFNDSDALIDGKFAGLPLDEDNEPEKTHTRIDSWLEAIKKEGF